MEVQAHLNNLRISARKVRLVVDVVRGMNIDNARIQLGFLNKKSSEPVLKLLNSAIANAKHNFNLSDDNLYISKIFVNEGTTLKRWIPRAMGRASRINKRTSHITIILDELKKENSQVPEKNDLHIKDSVSDENNINKKEENKNLKKESLNKK